MRGVIHDIRMQMIDLLVVVMIRERERERNVGIVERDDGGIMTMMCEMHNQIILQQQ